MRLSQEKGIVYVLKPADHAAGATGESINTANCSHITFLVQCATFTDNVAAGADLTIKSGATDAAQTTAETFYYRLAGAVQGSTGADVYGDLTSATTLELTSTAYSNRLLICELDVASLTEGQPYVTLALNNHGSAANCSVVAILSGERYKADDVNTSIS